MVRVLVERQLKHGEDIGRLLLKLHMIAVLQKGHISNETWINTQNEREVVVISSWRSQDDWKAWEASKERAGIIDEIKPLIAEDAKVKIYELMTPEDCEYYEDPQAWMQTNQHPRFLV
jgi:heme-degrading monooxygenase HmoA